MAASAAVKEESRAPGLRNPHRAIRRMRSIKRRDSFKKSINTSNVKYAGGSFYDL